jgi:hypothetical protein
MRRRITEKQRQNRLAVALIAGMIVLTIAIFPLFDWIDCQNTERFARAYEACIASETCEPSAWQHGTYGREGMTIAHCRLDD